ncbi:MAG: molybdopterin-dependent oxidoreductase, partial [Gemmatimonadaceae bacterium]
MPNDATEPMSRTGGTTAVRRREFLKVLGASTAAATAVGCTNEHVEQLIPYLTSPDNTVPGVSTYFATTCRECATACGVIAEVRDGRAIKLEGNPDHPLNHGALCARGQSALQGLYNPDRFRTPMLRQNGSLTPTTWETAITTLTQRIAGARAQGQNVVFINQAESGSFPAFLDSWLGAFGFPAHIAYDAEADLAAREANRQQYGGVQAPTYDFAAAKLIVSFGADFLETWGASVPQQLSFGDARAALSDAPRFIYIGPRRSLTGLNADDWIPARAGSELGIVKALLAASGAGGSGTLATAAQAAGVEPAVLERLSTELRAATSSLVLAGTTGPDAFQVAAAVNTLNRSLGNEGKTVKPAEPIASLAGPIAGVAHLAPVIARMNSGAVPLAFVRGANPAHTTPKQMQFATAFAKVPFKVSFSSVPDETTLLCDLVLPDHHSLESWGDAQPVPGTVGLQQPVMEPVFTTRAMADVLLGIARADAALASRYPVATYREWLSARLGGPAALTAALPSGMIAGAVEVRTATAPESDAPGETAPLASQTGDFDLVVYPSPTLGDGRGANKPWLQELPDPVTKICWQSVVEIHPLTAGRLGIKPGDHVTVTTSAGSVTAPAYLYLGVRQDTVAIATGQGHTGYGRYAERNGVNALDLLTGSPNGSGGLALTQLKASLTKTADHSMLVSTEGSARQHGRGVAQAVTVADLLAGRSEEHEAFPGDKPHEFLPGLKSPVASDAIGDLA